MYYEKFYISVLQAVTVIGKMASPVLSLSCKEAIENTTEYIFKEGRFYDGLLELIKEYR